MGCDIHFFVERRRADGSWEYVKPAAVDEACWSCGGTKRHCELCDASDLHYRSCPEIAKVGGVPVVEVYENAEDDDGRSKLPVANPCRCGDGLRHPPFYVDRDYDVFAVLANVRNGYGFAGVETGEGYVPLDMPRGLPKDVTPEVREESDSWGADGHSHSHFTLAEIDAAVPRWTTMRTTCMGVVDVRSFLQFKKNEADGKTGEAILEGVYYCGGVSGSNVKVVSRDEMEAVVAAKKLTLSDVPSPKADWKWFAVDGVAYHTQVSWEITYAETMARFLERMEAVRALGEPSDMRLVFWFDN